jgi:hypothetical protein
MKGADMKQGRAMLKRTKWKMPPWIEPYREAIVNTGGNSIEDLMDDRSNVVINAPFALISCAVQSQVSLLTKLHTQGII